MSTTLLILLILSSKSNSIVPRSRDNWPRSTEFVGFIEISIPILCLRTPGFFFLDFSGRESYMCLFCCCGCLGKIDVESTEKRQKIVLTIIGFLDIM